MAAAGVLREAPLRKPCIIAIKTRTVNEQGTPRHHMRDMVVIEYRRPRANTQMVWIDLLEEAVKRLDHYSSKQSTFLIAIIGSNCMGFLLGPHGHFGSRIDNRSQYRILSLHL